jgi:hypothetical protein
MALFNLWGDPEGRRRHQHQTDLDANYYKRRKAYNQQLEKEQVRQAQQRAVRDANRQPFYRQVLGMGKALGKDLIAGANQTNPDALFNFDKPNRRRKKKRR